MVTDRYDADGTLVEHTEARVPVRYRVNAKRVAGGRYDIDVTCEGPDMAKVLADHDKLMGELETRYPQEG
jgi:hypothetical protein